MVKNLLLSVSLILAGACSLASRKDQAGLRELYKKGEIDKALTLLENSEFKKDEKNRLLYLLQKGRLTLAKGRPDKAAAIFEQASSLMDKLYTKSVTETLLTSVSNNNNETYYGSPYERSLLYFYQAMSFLQVYKNGYVSKETEKEIKDKDGNKKIEKTVVRKELNPQERRRYLFKARAAIVAWDVFYKELQRSSRETTVFDHDLFAKIIGGQVHEVMGNRNDDQIALQLYKDAYSILEKTGPAFKSFNPNFRAFAKSLKGEKNEGEEQALELSQNYKNLSEFLKLKILSLVKKRRGWKFKEELKRLKPEEKTLARLKKDKNVTILLEDGLVSPLVGEEFSYNLKTALNSVEDPGARALLAAVGLPAITYFAMGPLGLGSYSRSGNRQLYVGHDVGMAMAAEAGIEFEMPVIKEPASAPAAEISVYKTEGEKEELVAKAPLALGGPISDLAYQMNLERASASFASRGSRIAVKHVLAIIAAYKTYESVKNTSGEIFAKPAAFAAYLLAAKTIKETERADTRQWSVLPSQVYLAEFSLPPGEYLLKVTSEGKKNPTVLGDLIVRSKKKDIFSYHLP